MRSFMTRLAALSALWLTLMPLTALAQLVDGITVLEAGTFTGRHEGRQASPRTASGTINIVSDRKLIEATDRICARLGVFFGVSYVLQGSPNGANVMLDLVTRFPEPGMINAKGQRFQQNEFPSLGVIGERGVRTFSFDEPWELLAGTWVFEFHYKGRKIGQTSFEVMTTCEVS
jgi:Domain of unknown function (DUF3859)